ncbi:MAG: ABC transporter permease [Chloroflexi bacterium]|nr:MAG: ABC transporter permease [Chloroflexota bacterium]
MIKAIRRNRSLQIASLIFPSAFWLVVFFLAPLGIMLLYSFGRRGTYGGVVWDWNVQQYLRFVDPLYLQIFFRSVWIAVLTTVICLVVGYPFAFFIARQPARRRSPLLLLVMIPFWTNFLIRTYAWILILRTEGLVNTVLLSLGLISQPLTLLYTSGAVILGLVYGYLPFMVLPLYASIEKFDFSLVEAAFDLGANEVRAFLRVVLPQTMPGVIAGCILVFIPSIGAFVTPDILGGAKTVMIGNLVQQQFLTSRDWPFGSAVSFILMLIVTLAIVVYFRTTEEELR